MSILSELNAASGGATAAISARVKLTSHDVELLLKKRPEVWITKVEEGKSPIWESFLRVHEVVNGEPAKRDFAQCIKCNSVLTGGHGGLTQLSRHEKSCKHKAPVAAKPITEHFVPLSKRNERFPTQQIKKQLGEAAAKFCARDVRPFAAVEGKGMLALLQLVSGLGHRYPGLQIADVMPKRQTVSRRSSELADAERAVFMPILKDIFVSIGGGISTDMWSDDFRKIAYLCLCAHYITVDWELVERVLATRSFERVLNDAKKNNSATSAGHNADMTANSDDDDELSDDEEEVSFLRKKNADNIRSCIKQILLTFGLTLADMSRVFWISDRGSNILKALEGYPHISCADHLLNTVLSHVNRKVVAAGAVVKSCNELVRYFKKSGLMPSLEKNNKTLKSANATRWKSRYECLRSVDDAYEEVEQILRQHDRSELLEAIDRKVMRDYIEFLRPFITAIDKLQATKQPTLHLVIPQFQKLKAKLENSDVDDSDFTNELKEQGLALMREKCDKRTHNVHKVALVLDPKCKGMTKFALGERDRCYKATREMLSRVALPDVLFDETGEPSRKRTRREVARNSDHEFEDSTDEEVPQPPRDELGSYLSCKDDAKVPLLEWWKAHEKTFPRLALLAKRVLAVPASSAGPERDFSVAGRTVEERRASLDPDSVDNLLFLHSILSDSVE